MSQYITSYCTKGELESNDMFTILAEDCERKRKIREDLMKQTGESYQAPVYDKQLMQFVNSLHGAGRCVGWFACL